MRPRLLELPERRRPDGPGSLPARPARGSAGPERPDRAGRRGRRPCGPRRGRGAAGRYCGNQAFENVRLEEAAQRSLAWAISSIRTARSSGTARRSRGPLRVAAPRSAHGKRRSLHQGRRRGQISDLDGVAGEGGMEGEGHGRQPSCRRWSRRLPQNERRLRSEEEMPRSRHGLHWAVIVLLARILMSRRESGGSGGGAARHCEGVHPGWSMLQLGWA